VKGLKQKTVWVVVLGGLFVLAFFTMSNGQAPKNLGGGQNDAQVAAESQSQGIFDNWGIGGDSGQITGGGSQENASKSTSNQTAPSDSYSTETKSGGVLGGSYLLKNMSSTKGNGYESANIFVKSINNSPYFPKYTAELSGDVIIITLKDTRNFNLDTGSTSYDGYNPQNINGRVIRSLKWEQVDESIIKIKVQLKYKTSFKTIVLNNPLALEVRVKI